METKKLYDLSSPVWEKLDPQVASLHTAERLAEDINALKPQFLNILKGICPDFTCTPKLAEALNEIYLWAVGSRETRLDPRKGLWIYGEPASGKTTIAIALSIFLPKVRAHNSFVEGTIMTEPINSRYVRELSASSLSLGIIESTEFRYDIEPMAVLVVNDLNHELAKWTLPGSPVTLMEWLTEARIRLNRNRRGTCPTVITSQYYFGPSGYLRDYTQDVRAISYVFNPICLPESLPLDF